MSLEGAGEEQHFGEPCLSWSDLMADTGGMIFKRRKKDGKSGNDDTDELMGVHSVAFLSATGIP